MKVAINVCYGGFSLSEEAQVMFFKKKYENLYFYKKDNDDFQNLIGFKKITEVEFLNEKDIFNHHIMYRDLGQYIPFEQIDACEYFVDYDLLIDESNRTDADLIEVIETLGEKKASGIYSKIKIVEIPDDVEYEIEEHHGIEWIAEKHRTWR